MTKDVKPVEQSDGLPQLDAAKKSNKKPPVLFVIGLIVVILFFGVAVQYAINNMSLFKGGEVKTKEPPVPVIPQSQTDLNTQVKDLQAEDSAEPPPATEFTVGGVLESVSDLPGKNRNFTEQGVTNASLDAKQLTELNESLKLVAVEVGTMSGLLKRNQEVLSQLSKQQAALAVQLEMESSQRLEWDEKILAEIKQNERWLGGISNQLKDIGVEVKVAAQEFPIVVYNRNIWGDDVYLTIATKTNPDQTSFLRVGGIVGRWRLVEIMENKAVFEHFEGNRREVIL